MYDLYNDDPVLFTLECASREFDIEMRELEFMQEMVEFRERQDIDRASLKVFAEGGTDDDLLSLYEQIYTESEEPKKGIISRIWESICKMLKAIKDAITGLFTSKVPDQVAIDESDWETIQELDKVAKNKKNAVLKAAGILLGITAAAGVGYAGYKHVQHKNALADGHKAAEYLDGSNPAVGIAGPTGSEKPAISPGQERMLIELNKEVSAENLKNLKEKHRKGIKTPKVILVPGPKLKQMADEVNKTASEIIALPDNQAASGSAEASKATNGYVRLLREEADMLAKAVSSFKRQAEKAAAAVKATVGDKEENRKAWNRYINAKNAHNRAKNNLEAYKRKEEKDEKDFIKSATSGLFDNRSASPTINPEAVEKARRDYLNRLRRADDYNGESAEVDIEGDSMFESGSLEEFMNLIDSI